MPSRFAFHNTPRRKAAPPKLQGFVGDFFDVQIEPRTKTHATPAAHAAAVTAKLLKNEWALRALTLYAGGAELTPDEASDRIDWTKDRSIKPRISNMVTLTIPWLEPTGLRRAFRHDGVRRGPGDVLRITAEGGRIWQLLQQDQEHAA